MNGDREEVAARLRKLVDCDNVTVSPSDNWMPFGKPTCIENDQWDKTPATEARIDKTNCLVYPEIRNQLREWWLCHGGNTPNWDIASTCHIEGKRGLILIEAKAHEKELDVKGKSLSEKASQNSKENHKRIGDAIAEANSNLPGKTWNLSRDHHYQLSNRCAWSWKLASLGIPIVLVYLGFLNACDMDRPSTTLFHSQTNWERVLKNYGKDTIDNTYWDEGLHIGECRTPLIPLIRTYSQHFDPKNP